MDSQHFDRLTQQFGTALSRRGLGAVLAALGLAASLGVGSEARNKKKKKKADCDRKQKQKCRRQDRDCEDGKCVVSCNARNSACRADVVQICGDPQDFCVCSPLAGGGFVCAEQRPDECPEFSDCIGNLDCARGEVCVDISGEGCCGEERIGLCLKRCSGKTPGF